MKRESVCTYYVSANTNRLVRYNYLVQLRAVVHAAGNPLSLCYTALYVWMDVYMYIRIMLAEKRDIKRQHARQGIPRSRSL